MSICQHERHDFVSRPSYLQTVVLPNGKVVKTRRRARKSSTGFDTTKLFVGAEGTLVIVTEGKQVASFCTEHTQMPHAKLL